MKRVIQSYFVEQAVIWTALGLYWLFPFADLEFSNEKGFFFDASFSTQVLFGLTLLYAVVSIGVHVSFYKRSKTSKIQGVIVELLNNKLNKKSNNNLLFLLVKFFFIPIMVPAAIEYVFVLKSLLFETDISFESNISFFNNYLYYLLTYIVVFFTLVIYSFGYLIESKKLKSKVISVDNDPFSWAVTLLCYAPFAVVVKQVIPLYSHNFSFFLNEEVTLVVRCFLLLMMFFMLWSVISLGFKSSNLTNRGVVRHGAFKIVRHPHYAAKLCVWWLNFLPLMWGDLWMIGGMCFWTFVYISRAMLEEKHLKLDPDYLIYTEQVKWRFVPFIW